MHFLLLCRRPAKYLIITYKREDNVSLSLLNCLPAYCSNFAAFSGQL